MKLAPLLYELVPTLKPNVSAHESFKTFSDSKDDLTPIEKQHLHFFLERIIGGAAGPMKDLNVFYPMTGATGRLFEGYDQLIAGGYNALVEKVSEGLDIDLVKLSRWFRVLSRLCDFFCSSWSDEIKSYRIRTSPAK